MHSTSQKEVSLPWYRYAMVWLIIGLLLAVVVASMVTVKVAFNNAPDILEYKATDQAKEVEDKPKGVSKTNPG